MSAAADRLTLAESEAICASARNIADSAERMAQDFGVVAADRDRLRLAHHLALSSLAELRDAFRRGDITGCGHLAEALHRHAAAHAYGHVPAALPAGVIDLDEVRDRRADAEGRR